MGAKRTDTTDGAYRKARKQFLLEWGDACHWCRRREAVQVDHVIPVDAGIDPTDQSNWVGSCARCNAKRGADYLANKRAGIIKARLGGTTPNSPADVFCTTKVAPPTPLGRSLSTKSEGNGNSPAPMNNGRMGEILPRLETAPTGVFSFGPDVATVARRELGMELMPWQVRALSGQLEHDGEGKLVRRRSLVTCARQNGKTAAIKALILFYLLEETKRRGKPVLVISTAHQLNLAAEIFDSLHPLLTQRHNARAKQSHGRQEATMPDGSRWLVQAATKEKFHGYSPDLVVADEIWGIDPAVLLNGILPSQRVVQSPLLSCWSTAGTDASRALNQMRAEGLNAIDEGKTTNLYFAEWSPPPDVDHINHPEYWHLANPALGYTLEREVLDDEVHQVDKSAFLRASLNVLISSTDSWLPPGQFDSLTVGEIPAGGVLAVDSFEDGSLYAGVRAVAMEDGMIGVTVAFVTDSLAGCWRECSALAKSCSSIALTPSLFSVAPLELEHRKVQVGYREIKTHAGMVRSLLLEDRISHTGEQVLREHVNRTVGIASSQGYTLSSQKSNGPITLARCMVWAVSIVARPQTTRRPQIAFSR